MILLANGKGQSTGVPPRRNRARIGLSILHKNNCEEVTMSLQPGSFPPVPEDTAQLARKVFKKDDLMDDINKMAASSIANYIKENPDKIEHGLYILSTIRKLERVGDQAKNMAEEIIFYSEAKILKHRPKHKKDKWEDE